MNDIIADEPEPPPRFPVMTGVAAGLWIAHGCIYSALQATSLMGFDNRIDRGGFCCCLPVSSLFLVSGVLTIFGWLWYKEFIEILGLMIGIGELYVALLMVKDMPAYVTACTMTAGVLLIAAYVCCAYDLDEYNRWVLARKLQNRDEED